MLAFLRGLLQSFSARLSEAIHKKCKFRDPKCKAYNGGGILSCTCGKGETTINQPPPPQAPPPPPAPGETSAEAIQAQIDAIPKILDTQREFGPQFTQLQLEELNRFGPEFAQVAIDLAREFGPQLAEQT